MSIQTAQKFSALVAFKCVILLKDVSVKFAFPATGFAVNLADFTSGQNMRKYIQV